MKYVSRIEWLNDLRGLAVLSVLFSHLFLMFLCNPKAVSGIIWANEYASMVNVPYFIAVIPFGAFGVAIFFLLSGYVIALSLAKSRNIGKFLLGRFLRIYPLYWISLSFCLIMLFVNKCLYGSLNVLLLSNILIHYIVGIRDMFLVPSIDGIIWTLEIEVKFYVFMAFFYVILKRFSFLSSIIAIINLFLLYFSINHNMVALPTDLSMQFGYIVFMLIGTNIYFISQSLNRKIYITNIVLLFFSFSVMFFYNLWMKNTGFIVYLAYIVALAVFIVAYRFKFKSNLILNYFADISYPLYLIHAVIGYSIEVYLLNKCNLSPWLCIVISIILVVIFADLLHRYIELPLISLNKKINSKYSQ